MRIWNLGDGRQLCVLTGHAAPVYAVAVTPKGHLAISASRDCTLKVWDLGTGRELRTLNAHTGPVYAVATTSDGKHVVSASRDSTLKVWRLETGEVLASFTCDSTAYCCVFAGDEKVIVAGDAGGHVHFLRLEEPKP